MSLLEYTRIHLDYSFLSSGSLDKEILDEAPLSLLLTQFKIYDSTFQEKTKSKPEIQDSRAELWQKMFGEKFVSNENEDIVSKSVGTLSEDLELTDDDIDMAIKKANN